MFLPCLTFHAIANGVSPAFFKEQWVLSLAGIIVVIIGMIFGEACASMLRVSVAYRPWFVLAVSQPNMIALPLVLVEAICRESEESHDSIAACVDGATTRLFTVTLLNSLFFWTVVQAYVRFYTEHAKSQPSFNRIETGENESLENGCTIDEESESVKNHVVAAVSLGHAAIDQQSLSDEHIEASTNVAQPSLASNSASDKLPSGTLQRMCRSICAGLCEPPSIASIVGICFAFYAPAHGLLYGPQAPASFLASVITVAGKASPVAGALLTGGSFGLLLLRYKGSSESCLSVESLGVSLRLIICTAVMRIVIIPMACLALLALTIDRLPEDNWSRLVLFFQPAGVTANVVSVLAQLSDLPDMAQFIAVATVPEIFLYVPTSTFFIAFGMSWGRV